MNNAANPAGATLREALDYEPQTLRFGTSGRRGEVVHLSQLEVYINALAEIEYLQSLPRSAGGISPGDPFYFACDLRPSSTAYVAAQGGRGELAQAIQRAMMDAGMRPVYLGQIPTPALTYYALRQGHGSIMVTGSHIPFDRNGYKTNSARGELLKQDEAPINQRVEQVRQRLYEQPFSASRFDAHGRFKDGHQELVAETSAARTAYIKRYTDFFDAGGLRGRKLAVYQHSAVGRDLLVEILAALGAEVAPMGRTNHFVPIDTENIDQERLDEIQSLVVELESQKGPVDAVVSLDGDSDRPLILAVEHPGAGAAPRLRFFGGDLVGMVVAEYLEADAVVVPISCNDAIDLGPLRQALEPKTRIGSPQVIAGMQKALAKGKRRVCGWEANGGFLTGSDLPAGGRTLTALPTRDALLPILGALLAAGARRLSLSALFDQLPRRFSRAALLKQFPRAASLEIIRRLSPAREGVTEIAYDPEPVMKDENGAVAPAPSAALAEACGFKTALEQVFDAGRGFGPVARINYTDGVRIHFRNGDIAHVRPSGNADELRIYAVADTQARADAVAQMGIQEPDGLLRRLAQNR